MATLPSNSICQEWSSKVAMWSARARACPCVPVRCLYVHAIFANIALLLKSVIFHVMFAKHSYEWNIWWKQASVEMKLYNLPNWKRNSWKQVSVKIALFIYPHEIFRENVIQLIHTYSEVSNSGTCTPIYFWVQIAQKPAISCNFM